MAGIWLHPDGCSHHGEIGLGKPGQLVVKFGYSVGITAVLKQLPRHRWNPADHTPPPLIKQVDGERALRGTAYGTRKSYG
jgi:hypothetical protein